MSKARDIANLIPATKIDKTSDTGSAEIPTGTTAQRDVAPTLGNWRENTTLNVAERWNGSAWASMGDGSRLLSVDNLLHVIDEKTSGTVGGGSLVGDNIREINTVLVNNITGAGLSTNQITLPAGEYYIEGSAPAFKANRHKLSLYSVSDAAHIVIGNNFYAANVDTMSTTATLSGVIVLGATKILDLRHYMEIAISPQGLGVETSSGLTEVYAEIKIWKVA